PAARTSNSTGSARSWSAAPSPIPPRTGPGTNPSRSRSPCPGARRTESRPSPRPVGTPTAWATTDTEGRSSPRTSCSGSRPRRRARPRSTASPISPASCVPRSSTPGCGRVNERGCLPARGRRAPAWAAEAHERARRLGLDRESRTAIVILIDGLGERQLRRYSGYTPFFRSLAQTRRTLSAGFPSTTANSLSSLATGRLPGAHGVVGYRVLDPDRDAVFNQLTWNLDVDPVAWVPDATLFERLTDADVDVVSLGEKKFSGRGLNRASLRGGRFRASK